MSYVNDFTVYVTVHSIYNGIVKVDDNNIVSHIKVKF